MRRKGSFKPLLYYQCKGICFLFLFSLIFTTNVFGADLNNKIEDVGVYEHRLLENRDESTVICGDFRVTAFSDYRNDGKYRDTIRQYFEFTDLTNGEKKMVVATTMAKLDGYDKEYWADHKIKFEKMFQDDFPLDGTADAWVCLQVKTDYYIAIEYGTGGNCNDCEWVEIMNKEGEILDRSVKNRRQDNYVHYEQTLVKLGLPIVYVRSLVKNHNLKYNNRICPQSGLINR